jgi:hypothetical protein
MGGGLGWWAEDGQKDEESTRTLPVLCIPIRQFGIELRLASSLSGKKIDTIFDTAHVTLRQLMFKIERFTVHLRLTGKPEGVTLSLGKKSGESDLPPVQLTP